jgi:hypothetical protein
VAKRHPGASGADTADATDADAPASGTTDAARDGEEVPAAAD